MKYIKFLLIGILFGIIMTKSEAISWYRIQEMFRFQSFHMYGIIGSTVVLGMIMIQLIKYKQLRSIAGKTIQFQPKEKGVKRYLLRRDYFWIWMGANRFVPWSDVYFGREWLFNNFSFNCLRNIRHLYLWIL